MKYLALGSRIKAIRERKRLSLEQVSRKTGLLLEKLERIENDKEQPLIATLIQLSKAMDVNVAEIFRDRPATTAYEISRGGKQREKVRPLLKPNKAHLFDYSYELLISPGNDKHLNAYLVEFPARQSKRPTDDVTHTGEEFIYMLEGEVEGVIAGDKIHLKPGDSLFFRSTESHVFFNPHETVARAIAVVYPF